MHRNVVFRVASLSLAAIASMKAPTLAAQAAAASNVSPSIRVADDLGSVSPDKDLTLTVQFKLPNQAAFDKAVEALYDPASPTYHHWMTNAELARFAPPQAQRELVQKELESHGLSVVSVDENGFSLRVHGLSANVESAFKTPLHEFVHNGKHFRAHLEHAQLTGEAGNYVSAVMGLESHPAHPMLTRARDLRTGNPYPPIPLKRVEAAGGLSSVITDTCLFPPATLTIGTANAPLPVGVFFGNVYDSDPKKVCDYTASQLQAVYDLPAAYKQGLTGKGQTIVLIEAYGYPTIEDDANAFSKLNGLPPLNSSNFQIYYPQGKPNPTLGPLLGWDGEIALDVQWAHSMAPEAKIAVVVTSGQDSEDFQNSIRYAAYHHLGNVMSNSWELDIDLLAGPLEQKAFDQTITIAAAKGISVNFSTGDAGDSGLGTPMGAAGIPSDSPHATAVGGTAILNKVGSAGFDTVGWGDAFVQLGTPDLLDPPVPFSGGGSGGGESLYFKKPSWQKKLPGSGRQTPDVSALADPYTGVPIVLTTGGKQNVEVGVGGTSLACPIFSAIWAIANQKAGHPLGQAAPLIAALPSAAIEDVLPLSSPTNVAGTIFDAKGATFYSQTGLFGPLVGDSKGFISALYPEALAVIGFGLDGSLVVTPGWDDVTGYGTPNGLPFIDAAAK